MGLETRTKIETSYKVRSGFWVNMEKYKGGTQINLTYMLCGSKCEDVNSHEFLKRENIEDFISALSDVLNVLHKKEKE